MGKAQVKKKTDASRRHNPIRVPDAHLGGGRVEGKNPTKERQMLPILDKLRAPEASDRSWACAAVCNLIQNDAATRRLFQGRNVVGLLVERLSDDADDVVVEASGALRNLAIDGGHELCGEMYNKGVVPHVITLAGKINAALESWDSLDGEARQALVLLAENVITLIWCLAEANHKTLAAINAAGTEALLMKVLGARSGLNPGVVLATAQALYALTQDNWPFTRALLERPGAIDTLVAITRADHAPLERDLKGKGKGKAKEVAKAVDDEFDDGRMLLTRLLAAGTLLNAIEPGSKRDTIGLAALTSDVILPLATSLLDVSVPSVVERVSQLVAELPREAVPVQKDIKTDHRPPAELKLERIERALQAATLALEILTGLCAGLEDVAEEEGEGSDAEMEDAQDDETLIAAGRAPGAAGAKAAPAKVNSAGLPHLLSVLPGRLAALAALTPLSLPPAGEASPHPPSTAALGALHLRALEALNNLLLSCVAAVANGEKLAIPAAELWAALFPVLRCDGAPPADAAVRGQEARRAIQEAALGCLWGVARAAPAALSPSAAEEELLTQVVGSSMGPDAQARAIEALAALAARPGVPVAENAHIGQWIAGLVLPNLPPTPVLIAALNALIDIYCDETRDYDQNWTYTEPLAKNVARIRGALRAVDKRKQPQLRMQADEIYDNLVAFIRWRRSL